MSADNYDIVIIGAGIAGLSAANAIASESDLSFALVEGKSIGSNNPSPLTFGGIIQQHDLTDCIKGRYSHFAFHNHKGSFIKYTFTDHPLVVLDYEKACRKLFNAIQKRTTAVEIIDTYATNISQNDKGVGIQLKGGRQLHASILIDCSGKSQFAITQLEENHFSYYSHVYGAVFSGIKGKEADLCCFLWPHNDFGLGGGWFYSIAGGKASFGYASINKFPNIDYTQLKNKFNLARKEFEPYSDYLRDAKLDYVETGSIPISYINKFIYKNMIIVGDAAGMATNWTCMGIEPALEYGKLAGELSVEALLQSDFAVLNQFQDSWEKANKATFDLFAKQAERFWVADYHFWEWIIKYDLAFLSPQEVLDRMRKNEHVPKKYQIIIRALSHKLRSIVNNNIVKPRSFIINN